MRCWVDARDGAAVGPRALGLEGFQVEEAVAVGAKDGLAIVVALGDVSPRAWRDMGRCGLIAKVSCLSPDFRGSGDEVRSLCGNSARGLSF